MKRGWYLLIVLLLLAIPHVFSAPPAGCDYELDNCMTTGWVANSVYCQNRTIKNASVSSTCISPTQNNVTIDCKGYPLIHENGSSFGAFGFNIGTSNVTVKNCNISYFDTAYGTTGLENWLINSTIEYTNGSTYIISIQSSPKHFLENVTLFVNGPANPYVFYFGAGAHKISLKNVYVYGKGSLPLLAGTLNFTAFDNVTLTNFTSCPSFTGNHSAFTRSSFINMSCAFQLNSNGSFNNFTNNTFRNVSTLFLLNGGTKNLFYDNVFQNITTVLQPQNVFMWNNFTRNSFLNYTTLISGTLNESNLFNNSAWGNYWDKFNTPAEGCVDADFNGFCDVSYNLSNVVKDHLPVASPYFFANPLGYPIQGIPILNSTRGLNATSENLTLYPQNAASPTGHPVKNISNWYLDDVPIAVLNLPFEGNTNESWSPDFSGYGNNATRNYGYNLTTTNANEYLFYVTAYDTWFKIHDSIDLYSENLSNYAGTYTYQRGVDYDIDYPTGRIMPLSGSQMQTDGCNPCKFFTLNFSNVNTMRTIGRDGFGAMQFDGFDDYLCVPWHPSHDIYNNLTLEAWFKPQANGGIVIGKTATWAGFLYDIIVDAATNRVRFQVYNAVTSYTDSNSSLSLDQWHHVAITYENMTTNTTNNTVRFYIDGVLDAIDTNFAGDVYGEFNHAIAIGMRGCSYDDYPYSGQFNGTIDDIRIYNRSLSAEQVRALYLNKTNVIVNKELKRGDIWRACNIPSDYYANGTASCSGNLTVLPTIPTHDTPILNSTLGTNTSNENLTVHPQNVMSPDGAPVKNITNWYFANGTHALTSITVLHMPFEGDINNSWVPEFSGFGNNATRRYGYNLTTVAANDFRVYANVDTWYKLHDSFDLNSENITNMSDNYQYVKDVDYEIDYANGRIRFLSSGDYGADGSIYANFKTLNYSNTNNIISTGFDNSRAIDLDGIDDYLCIAPHASHNVQDELTIEAWVKTRMTGPGAQLIVGKTTTWSGFAFGMYLDGSNKVVMQVYNAVTTTVQSNSSVPANEWTHLAITYKNLTTSTTNNTVRIYINGELDKIDTNFAGDVYGHSAHSIAIGATGCSYNAIPYSSWFNGTIDDVRIYNRSLSAEQVRTLFSNRTDILVSDELRRGETWTACVSPTNSETNGTTKCSNNVTIQNGAPSVASVILNSTYGTNLSSENLTAYPQNASDPDGDVPLRNITNWYVNDLSIAIVNLPFEANTNGTHNESNYTLDYSDHGNNGTILSVTFNATGGLDGGGAYYFDHVGYINISSLVASTNITDEITYSAWIYRDDGPGWRRVIGKYYWGGADTGSWAMFFDNQNRTGCTLNISGTFNGITGSIATAEREWTHVACTYDGSTITHYVNGRNAGSVAALGTIGVSDHPITIGATCHFNGACQNPFGGYIDNVLVLNRSLSYEQILAHNNSRVDIIVSNETIGGEVWKACVTGNDGINSGAETCSNEITIGNTPPTHDAPVLNSTFGTNLSSENLTAYPQNVQDEDGDVVRNITNWYVTNSSGTLESLAVINMPFEGGSNNNVTQNYAPYGNGVVYQTNNTPMWNLSGPFGDGAYIFNNTNSFNEHINLGSISDLPRLNSTTLTFTVWFKPEEISDSIFIRIGSGTDLFVGFFDRVVHWHDGGSFQGIAFDATANPGEWTHLALTILNTTTAKYYVNGTLIQTIRTMNLSQEVMNSGSQVDLGGTSGTYVQNLNGSMADFKAWDRVLSDDQIYALASGRDDIIVSNELASGETWQACVTPSDETTNGTTKCSNNVTIQSICTNVDRSIILTRNVSSPASCFNITAHNVEIDCAGYTINYSQSPVLGYGINNSDGYHNVTVRNCNIFGNGTNANHGIYFNNAKGGVLIGNNVTQHSVLGDAIRLYRTNHTSISEGRLYAYYGSGSTGGALIGIHASSNWNNVTNVTLSYPSIFYPNHMLYVSDSSDATLRDNVITSDAVNSNGIYLLWTNATLTGNKVNTSRTTAIVTATTTAQYATTSIDTSNLVEGLPVLYNYSLQNIVISNVNWSETYGEIICAYCSNVTYVNLTYGSDGIFLPQYAYNISLRNSTFISNVGHGIFSGNELWDGVVDNNQFTVGGNYLAGVLFNSGGGMRVENNTLNISSNYGTAIQIGYATQRSYVKNNNITTTGTQTIGLTSVLNSNQMFQGNRVNTTGSNSYALYVYYTQRSNFSDNWLYTSGYAAYGISLWTLVIGSNFSNNNVTTIYPDATTVGIFLDPGAHGNNTFLNNSVRTHAYAFYDNSGDNYANNLRYESPYGAIQWTNTSNGGFLKNLISGGNFTPENIRIASEVISMDTFDLTQDANDSINLTFVTTSPYTSIMHYGGYSTSRTDIFNLGVNCTSPLCAVVYQDANTMIVHSNITGSFATLPTNPNCGALLAEDTTLVGNMTCSGTALSIGAHGITLDCAGYSVNYSTGGSGYGINNTDGYENITIKDCNVIEGTSGPSSNHGMYFYRSKGNNLSRNNVTTYSTNTHGIYLEGTNWTAITGGVLNTSASLGSAIKIASGSRWNNVTNVTLSTGALSIYGAPLGIATSSYDTTLRDNLILANGQYSNGVDISNSNATLTGNRIYNPYQTGLLVVSSTLADIITTQIDTSNLVEGLPVLYNGSLENRTISNVNWSTTYGQIICASCKNVTYVNVSTSNDGFFFSGLNGGNTSVVNSTLFSTTGPPIYSFYLFDGSYSGNYVYMDGNYYSGFYISNDAGKNHIENNTFIATKEGNLPIVMGYTNYPNYARNNNITISGISAQGIYTIWSTKQVIENNRITATSLYEVGIRFADTDYSIARDNVIIMSDANSHGVNFQSGASYNNLTNNNITIANPNSFGIQFEAGSGNNTLLNNSVVALGTAIKDDSGNNIFNYLSYENSYGSINWSNTSIGGFLRNMNVTGNLTFPGTIYIGQNLISVNGTDLGSLINSTANVTLYNMGAPSLSEILKYGHYTTNSTLAYNLGTACSGSTCPIDYYSEESGLLQFTTTSLATFTANVSYCGNINSSITLSRSESSTGSCLNIKAHNIVVDCSGHTITYATGGTGYGINNSDGYQNITVKNCKVIEGTTGSNANHGVYFYRTLGGNLSNNNVTVYSSAANAILLHSVNQTAVTGGTLNLSGGAHSGHMLYILSSNWVNATNVTAGMTYNTGAITAEGSVDAVLRDNIVVGTGVYTTGIVFVWSNGTLTGNKVNTTYMFSYNYYGNQPHHFDTTSIDETNLAEGLPILVNRSLTNKVISNVNWSGYYGQVLCTNCSNITYINVSMSTDGFFIANGRNITLINSTILNTHGRAVHADYDTFGFQVVNNYIVGTGDRHNGILVFNGAYNRIENNTVITNGNTASGIYAAYSFQEYDVINNTVITVGDSSTGIQSEWGYHHVLRFNRVNTSGTTSPGLVLYSNRRTNVSDNLAYTTGGNSPALGLYYVSAYGTTDFNNITNNNLTALASNSPALLIQQGENNTFHNNSLISSNKAIQDDSGNALINFLSYGNEYGRIDWANSSSGGFLRNMNVTGNLTFPGTVSILENVSAINTASQDLNDSLNITFIGISSVDSVFHYAGFTTNQETINSQGVNCTSPMCAMVYKDATSMLLHTNVSGSFAVYLVPTPPTWDEQPPNATVTQFEWYISTFNFTATQAASVSTNDSRVNAVINNVSKTVYVTYLPDTVGTYVVEFNISNSDGSDTMDITFTVPIQSPFCSVTLSNNVSTYFSNYSYYSTPCVITSANLSYSHAVSISSRYSIFHRASVHNSYIFNSILDTVDAWHSTIENSNINCSSQRVNLTGTVIDNRLTAGQIIHNGIVYFAPQNLSTICGQATPIAASLFSTPSKFKNGTGVIFQLYASRANLNVTLNISDALLTDYNLNMSDDGLWPDLMADDGVFSAFDVLQTTTEGTKAAIARVTDNLGNTLSFNTTITADLTAPNASLVINGGDAQTNGRAVTLNVIGADESGIVGCRFGNENLSEIISCSFNDINCYPYEVQRLGNIGTISGLSSQALRSYSTGADQSYLLRTESVAFNYTDGTLSFWLKHPFYNSTLAPQSPYATFYVGDYGVGNFTLLVSHSTDNKLIYSITDSDGTIAGTSSDISFAPFDDQNWHFVTVTWNISGSTMISKIYLDGILRVTNTSTIADITDNNWTLAFSPSMGEGRETHIDNALVFARALTDGEILDLYHNPDAYAFTSCTDQYWYLSDPIGNKTVYAQVLDGAGNVKTIYSHIEYTGALSVEDATPPTNISVWDEGDYQKQLQSLSFIMDAIDPDSKILYEYRLFNSSAMLVDWTQTSGLGSSNSVYLATQNISHAEHYTLHVRAYNENNDSSFAKSDGIIADVQAPAHRGLILTNTTAWITTRNVTIYIDTEDNISGLSAVSYAMSTTGEGADTLPDTFSINETNTSMLAFNNTNGSDPFMGENTSLVTLDGAGNVYFMGRLGSTPSRTVIQKYSISNWRMLQNYTLDMDSGAGISPEKPNALVATLGGKIYAAAHETQAVPNQNVRYISFHQDGSIDSAWNMTHVSVNNSLLLLDSEENIVMIENIQTDATTYYLNITKYSQTASLLWKITQYNGSNSLIAFDAVHDWNNNLYVLTRSHNGACMLFSYSINGQTRWNSTLNTTLCGEGILSYNSQDHHVYVTGPQFTNATVYTYSLNGMLLSYTTFAAFPLTNLFADDDILSMTTTFTPSLLLADTNGSILQNVSLQMPFFSAPTSVHIFRKGVVDSRGNLFVPVQIINADDVRYAPLGVLTNPLLRGNFSVELTSLTDGIYNFSYRSSDKAANWQSPSMINLRSDATPPSTPQMLEGASSVVNPIRISWTAAADVVSGVSHYHIRIDDNADFSSPLYEAPVGNITYLLYNGSVNGTFYSSVRAENGAGLNSSWAQRATATLDLAAPIVYLSAPREGSVLTSLQPTLRITTDELAQCYVINGAKTEPFSYTGANFHETIPELGFFSSTDTSMRFACYDALNNGPQAGYQVQVNISFNPTLSSDSITLYAAQLYYLGSPINLSATVLSGATLVSGLDASDFDVKLDGETAEYSISEAASGNYTIYISPIENLGTHDVSVATNGNEDSAAFAIVQSNLTVRYGGEWPSDVITEDYVIAGTNSTFSLGLAAEDEDIHLGSAPYRVSSRSDRTSYIFATQGSISNIIEKKQRYLEDGNFLDQSLPTFGLPEDPTDYTITITLLHPSLVFDKNLELQQGSQKIVILHEGYLGTSENRGKANMSVLLE